MSFYYTIFILFCMEIRFMTIQISIRGKGSSFPYEIYKTWMKEYRFYRLPHARVEMSYDPVGSNEGQTTLLKRNSSTQYAGSSSALLAKKKDLVEFPSMAGAVVLAYNIPNLRAQLMLTQDHVVGIYNGTYRKWSDPSIQFVNPSVTLPDEYIKVVARGDRSGLTEVFTATLSSFSPEWKQKYGSFSGGKNITSGEQTSWKNDTIAYYGFESKGIIGIILSFHYTIGYLSVADAVESGLSQKAALIQNLEGEYTSATTNSVESAMQYFSRQTSNLTFVLGNAGGLNSYPITGFTYVVMRRSYTIRQCDVIKELVRYIDWFMTEKLQRDECKNFGMTPLSFELVERIQREVLRKISCNGFNVWEMVINDIANEITKDNAWIYPVKVAVPCLSLIFVMLVVYIIKQKINHWKQLYNDDWFIPIEDITFFYESRNPSSDKSKLFSKKSVWSLNAMAENSVDRRILDQIIQWPGMWNGNTIGLRLMCLPLSTISRPLKTHMLWLRGKVSHQNIVKFWGLTELETDKYVIGDYCEKGCLADILHDNKLNLGNDLKRALAIDVAQGMWYLHSREIIHGNLTSSVCLIDSKWTIKISDWEFVSLLLMYKDNIHPLKEFRKISLVGKDDTRYIEAVRDFWIAPEILRQDFTCVPTKQSDVYSYAIVLQEIYTREEPYSEHSDILSPKDVIEAVKLNNLRPSTSEDIPIVIRQVMEIAWCDNPVNRASFEEILKMLKQSGKERKSVLDSMMEAMEDYTAYLEEKVADKSSENNAIATKLQNVCKDMVPPNMVSYVMHAECFTPESYFNFGVVAVNLADIEYLMHVISPRNMFTNINRLYQDLISIGKKCNVFNLSASGSSMLFAIANDSRNRHPTQTIYQSTALFCLSIATYIAAENPKNTKYGFIGLKIGAHIGSGLISILGPSCPRYTVFSVVIEEAIRLAFTSHRSKIHISSILNDVIKDEFITQECKDSLPAGEVDETFWLLGQRKKYEYYLKGDTNEDVTHCSIKHNRQNDEKDYDYVNLSHTSQSEHTNNDEIGDKLRNGKISTLSSECPDVSLTTDVYKGNLTSAQEDIKKEIVSIETITKDSMQDDANSNMNKFTSITIDPYLTENKGLWERIKFKVLGRKTRIQPNKSRTE